MTKHKTYVCDFNANREVILNWCRKNFGEPGNDWEFYLINNRLCIDIMNDKYKVMYELWHG